jgi:hypothetical protein
MEWFVVSHDHERVTLRVSPPHGEAWEASFLFADIVRVCFEAEGLFGSDRIYVFVRGRDASYVIPTEAVGGSALWGELIERHLFDAKLAISAAGAEEGSLLCWPLI